MDQTEWVKEKRLHWMKVEGKETSLDEGEQTHIQPSLKIEGNKYVGIVEGWWRRRRKRKWWWLWLAVLMNDDPLETLGCVLR